MILFFEYIARVSSRKVSNAGVFLSEVVHTMRENTRKDSVSALIPGDLQHLTQRTQLLPGRASFRIKSDFSGNSTGLPIYWRSK